MRGGLLGTLLTVGAIVWGFSMMRSRNKPMTQARQLLTRGGQMMNMTKMMNMPKMLKVGRRLSRSFVR